MCLLSSPGVHNISERVVYNRNALTIFIMCLLLLPCRVLRSPGGKAVWAGAVPPSSRRWGPRGPGGSCSPVCGGELGDGPRDSRASDTEREPQLQRVTVMQKWNTLVKLKFVLIPSVGNTVNENRSNQIKIIYFISLQHYQTFQGNMALLYKPDIDAVPLFTSKTTKVKSFKCIKAILLIVSIEDSPSPLVKYP